ncbi:zeta toxin family protein [Photobacterium damselae subsp. damselae]|uniref:zeta toxin family protein n=1 Tax=Photobacterium damselae TaxID=38293 RepID=UPI00311B3B77
MRDYARPLNNVKLASHFITRVLQQECDSQVLGNLVNAEKLLTERTTTPTLSSDDDRLPPYCSDQERKALRQLIFRNLVSQNRLTNDDDISLEEGGVLPESGLKMEKQAIIITGLPASGKSTIAEKMADYYGAAIVDSDYAKRKFPEFRLAQGASMVHDESTLVTFGMASYPGELSVYGFMISSEANIVIPKIGDNADNIRKMRDDLIAQGYDVHLVLVNVNRVVSTKRALQRFVTTSRYVPLGLVFDGYANDPTLAYYRMKDDKQWASTGKLSTEGDKPILIHGCTHSPATILYGA